MKRIFTMIGPTRPVFVDFFGVPPGGRLSLVALIPSNGLGALLQVQGEFGAGNVYRSLVGILSI